MKEVVKKTRFIHKESGRVVSLSEFDLKILGDKVYKTFIREDSEPIEIAELKKKPIEIVVEEKVKEVPEGIVTEPVVIDRKSVREIISEIGSYTEDELFELTADERVTVQKAVSEELKKRDNGNQE